MDTVLDKLRPRVEAIRRLSGEGQGGIEWFEAANLAQTVLYDSVGSAHPLAGSLRNALDKSDYALARAAARTVVRLFDDNQLTSPRLVIAHELEGSLLEIAQAQVAAAESTEEPTGRTLRLAI